MRTYFYIIKHAVKPEHKIHVWTFYIPMYQCAVSRNAAFFMHLFFHIYLFSKFTLLYLDYFIKYLLTLSLLQKLFHPILPLQTTFPIPDPISTLCKVVVKYFYFEFIAIDTRHKTQMCMSHC